jgi:hypothetical protein
MISKICGDSSTAEQTRHLSSGGGSSPTFPLQYFVKAHQRVIREHHALESDPFIEEKKVLAVSLKNAVVREIERKTAKTIILKYEWLKTMGTTDFQFGLYFGQHLAGAVCFGRTAGTNTANSICGKEYTHLVKTLNRGACVHWSHPHSASFLIVRACKLMAKKGFHIFVAYSDPEAGEVGTVYQACGWNHCGTTAGGSTGFRWAGKPIAKDPTWGTFKDGKIHDGRNIHHSIRRGFRIECSRGEKRLRMIEEGFEFLQLLPRRRYVGFYGDKETVATLRAALRWETFPYPKRDSRVEGSPRVGSKAESPDQQWQGQ